MKKDNYEAEENKIYSEIDKLKKEARQILDSGRITNYGIQRIKMLFSRHYKISMRGESYGKIRRGIVNAVVDSIYSTVRDEKLNRKISKKKRQEIENE